MTIGYAITLLLALGLLIAYVLMVKNKEQWLTLLYVCVVIVNLGYLLLSMSKTLAFAIFSNDLVYLGSVFLSMCMFLTILRLCGFQITRTHVAVCMTLGVLMFGIAATVGFLPWYYKSVSLQIEGGVASLVKEYGVLHPVYLFYLLGYFVAMIASILHSVKAKQIGNPKFAGFLAGVVCGNLWVWLFEKFVQWEFEFLSVTYIVSELLLLLVYWMMQDYVHVRDLPVPSSAKEERLGVGVATMPMHIKIGKVLLCLNDGAVLSSREREILELILNNRKRREIAEELHLSENTVKTYTRTLYSKLGVSRREELYALLLQKEP